MDSESDKSACDHLKITDVINNATMELIPQKFRHMYEPYEVTFSRFMEWRKTQNISSFSDMVYKSNSREVTLRDVEQDTSGLFKCEVSADAPFFHTDILEATLLVADIPDDEPVLRTEVQKVAPGAKIRANCTTPGSYPPMNVTWYINDMVIHPKHNVQIEEAVNRYEALNDLDTVTSTITVRAVQDLFKNGKMKLKCLATLYSLYRREKEVEILEDAPLLALIMVPTTLSNEGINSGFRHSSSSSLKQKYCWTVIHVLFYPITRLMIR